MDVVINSQIQSPLVRTLARTKGKSQSFTHNIADNVAPCSFTKIQLSSQNQGETQFGRNYKLKIPQYGYLRDVVLKYTTKERAIDAKVVEIAKSLYTPYYTALEDIRAGGSYLSPNGSTVNPSTARNDVDSLTDADYTRNADITWFNAQNIVRSTAANGYISAPVIATKARDDIASVLVPQFQYLLTDSTLSAGFAGTNGITTAVLKSCTTAAATLVTAGKAIAAADTTAGPYTQLLKLNGSAAMWNAHFRLYYSIYELASVNGGATYPLAKAVWNALQNEPVQNISMDLYTSIGVTGSATVTEGIVTGDYTLAAIGSTNVSKSVACVMPKHIVATSRGGQTFWIPKIPQLRFDANGTMIGVDFVPLHLLHPNDNGDVIDDITLLSGKLSTVADTAKYNYRQFPFGAAKSSVDDWAPWDWQTESYYYQGIASNVAERVQLSTHNRPIQTIFPQETYARIQQFQPAERARYLKMMEARISQSGKSMGNANGTQGEKIMYFPLFLSSTENPSMNFDTRFVEQLDIDVMTNAIDRVFTASDVIQQKSELYTLTKWFNDLREYVFNFDWKYDTQTGPKSTTANGVFSAYSNPASIVVRTDLSTPGALNDKPDSYAVYNKLTPRSFVLSMRSFQTVPENYIKVEALCYFHNFHDATSQAIRDSNFKPGTPASLLAYNTYMETVRPIKLSELQNTTPIQALITSNNLVFGTTFMVRRRSVSPLLSNKRDHYMQTLPIKEVTLTASGQQIYQGNLDEAQLTDPFDHDLASGKIGRKYDRRLIAQSINDPITGEPLYVYHIPYGFSSDMTYNSGSVAFQTLNNPVLSVTIDVGSGASRPFQVTGDPAKEEFELVVWHNYCEYYYYYLIMILLTLSTGNMIRIDSNTGAITRSLDL
jgi:hypothetical protein